jgi:hypothetical protein
MHHETTIEAARVVLNRLKGYTIPMSAIGAARDMVRVLRTAKDPETMLAALEKFEMELIAIGGEYEPGLAETILSIKDVFPDAKLTYKA